MGVRVSRPTFQYEQALWRAGYSVVVGIDEVGRGPLAGPVVVAAVALPPFFTAPWLDDVRDSKELSPGQRERLAPFIYDAALGVGLGARDACQIDNAGLVPAIRAATYDALAAMNNGAPEFLLLDAFPLPSSEIDQTALIRGDSLSISIACASIVAKVTHDAIMVEMEERYPGYGFSQHKGYGTAQHLAALDRLGASSIHRASFAPVRARLSS